MGKVSKVVLYTTSTATTLKLKHDIKRIKELLVAKKVHFEEVKGVYIFDPAPASLGQGTRPVPGTITPSAGPPNRWTLLSSRESARR